MGIEKSDNVGVAFALVIGAGAATGVGGSVVFFPSLVRLASRRTLAAALGLSAGVMTFVSFVEILGKAQDAFEDAGFSGDDSALYMHLTFFAGVIFMLVLNSFVTWLLPHQHGPEQTKQQSAHSSDSEEGEEEGDDASEGSGVPQCICHDDDPGGTLDKVKNMAKEMEDKDEPPPEQYRNEQDEDVNPQPIDDEGEGSDDDNDDDDDEEEAAEKTDKKALMRMSLQTALAIGLHNFPEGLATFVAALDDPGVGAVLAMAIAIHNIPEGLCVAMPIYYATGNKWKAFGWALLSGIAEPVAGLCGWLILSQSFSDQLYGVLFGMVSGMMVIISVRELLPTAHRYDPADEVVTTAFIIGMAIMALSLILFLI